jgi:DNA-binding CsgD family transcriptional regulator
LIRDTRRAVIEWLGEPQQRFVLQRETARALPALADYAEAFVSAYLTELLEHPRRLARFRPEKSSFSWFILQDLIRFVRSSPLFHERWNARAGTEFDGDENLDRDTDFWIEQPVLRDIPGRARIDTPGVGERISPERQLRAIVRLLRKQLTDREYDVIALQVDGQRSEQIARLLGTTVSSVTSSARRAATKIRHVFELYSHKNEALVGQPLGDVVECSVFGPRSTSPGPQAFVRDKAVSCSTVGLRRLLGRGHLEPAPAAKEMTCRPV